MSEMVKHYAIPYIVFKNWCACLAASDICIDTHECKEENCSILKDHVTFVKINKKGD